MDSFEFSVKCSNCQAVHVGEAKDAFAYIAAARVLGWEVPDVLTGQPIKCPTCKVKP